MKLPIFSTATIPSDIELAKRLVSPRITRIIHFALGPAGTNIAQAGAQWSKRMGVDYKCEMVLCATPEESVEQARMVTEVGVLPLFWTCAVYFRENEVFFENPDTLPFLFAETMLLDEMQLAVREDDCEPRSGDKIASHLSPAPLVWGNGFEIVKANSNAAAAQMCAKGEVEACITTESARRIHNLSQVHSFGSPPMVFFGGTTQHGIAVLRGR